MMANIRFVKPPNDNRIRSLPCVDGTPTPVPKENFFITTTAPKISNVRNISNSKQKSFTDTANMFITSRNNNFQTGMSSSLVHEETICNSNNKYDNSLGQTNVNFDSTRRSPYRNLASNNVFTANQIVQQKAINSNVSSELSAYDNEHSNSSSTAERNNNNVDAALRNITESCSSINNDNATETAASIQDTADEYRKNSSLRLMESQKEKDDTKFQLMSFDSDQNDDPEEEEDKFPELNSLFGNMESNVCQEKQPMLIPQNDQPKPHSKSVQEKQLMTSSASPSLSTASLGRQRQQLSYLFQSGARNRPTRSYRPIHRSVSDAALIENNRLTSFFKSITDDKYYGLDEEDYDDDDDTDINFTETSDSIKKNELRRLTQPSKVAWDTSINNHQGGNIFGETKETATKPDPSKSPATKPGDGHIAFSRSLSGDSMITDRLRIRRCALADPESMIMRQEVREKIEREVERRRSSMVRKISQFFNVHLGLNKEEDLI